MALYSSEVTCPGSQGDGFQASSGPLTDPELGVFRDTAKCTGSNDRNARPGAEKGPSNGDGPEDVFSIISVHIS